MAKIINFYEATGIKERSFEDELNEKIQKVEEELGIEEEPLTVLTDNTAISIINDLIDIRDSTNELLDKLGFEESGDLPWEK